MVEIANITDARLYILDCAASLWAEMVVVAIAAVVWLWWC